MVLGYIIYCLYFGKELTEAFMVEPVNQPYAAQWCNGSHAGLKILWTEVSVSVRVRPELLIIML